MQSKTTAPQHLSQPPRVRMCGIAFGQLLVMLGDKGSKKFGYTHLAFCEMNIPEDGDRFVLISSGYFLLEEGEMGEGCFLWGSS